jgi:hypothetical protein
MDHLSPFQTSTFTKLFNDVRKYSIQWFLTPIIALWKFRSPSGLQLPKWEFSWESGTFPHTFLYSWEYELSLLGFILGLHFRNALVMNPRLGLRHLVFKVYMMHHPRHSHLCYAHDHWLPSPFERPHSIHRIFCWINVANGIDLFFQMIIPEKKYNYMSFSES